MCLISNQRRRQQLPIERNRIVHVKRTRKKWSSWTCTAISNLMKASIVLIFFCYPTNYKVVAIRKGRLLSPSSFTALSGDLHVQIHYNINDTVMPPAPMDVLTSSNGTTSKREQSEANKGPTPFNVKETSNSNINSTVSVLVISRYADEASSSDGSSDRVPTNVAVTANSTAIAEQLLQRRRKEIVRNIPLYHDPRLNVTQIAVPCQTFVRGGGLYEMKVISNLKNTLATDGLLSGSANSVAPTMTTTTTLIPTEDERLRQVLDVRWPSAVMEVHPTEFRTYPDHPIDITLRFPDVDCDNALHSPELPDFWLELVYYGKDRTHGGHEHYLDQHISNNINNNNNRNSTQTNVLFAEQVRGFPKHKTFQLGCELFGLAGQYAVQLRPMVAGRNVPTIRRYLTIDWSDKFVFNVYASSIFPCDTHTGIGVLYEYPKCILEQGDRVRVYAKLRADVASLKPPTSLHYVAEQRVVKSQHALYFSCELFSEKYVEYCFKYVSQAISGAVADVRMDCVPTLAVSDSDTGGWGPWSDWTPCSTTCLGGTRNRHRFCDHPPPRYGAKFCEGNSVETEKCGDGLAWSCIYQTGNGIIPTADGTPGNRTSVISQEIGPGCRCGCIVHLGASKPKRIIGGATQSCPGRTFWLIQVDGRNNIAFSLKFLRLPCQMQYIKMRDGPSLSSTLLTELNGANLPLIDAAAMKSSAGAADAIVQLQTTGEQLLIEFYSGTTAKNDSTSADGADGQVCAGGFLANVEQVAAETSSSKQNGTTTPTLTLLAANKLWTKSNLNSIALNKSKYRTKFTLVHLSAVIFAAIIVLISALLGAQYVVRYRKYHLAIARQRDEGSRLHTPHASMNSLLRPPSRALSTTTLLSEVIYLVKMRPKHKLRHSILRESIDAENLARETEFTGAGGGDAVGGVAVGNKFDLLPIQMAKCEEELGSNGTLVTLRNEIPSTPTCSLQRSVSLSDNNKVTAEPNDNDDDDGDDDDDDDTTGVGGGGGGGGGGGVELVDEETADDDALSAHTDTLTHNTTKDSESIISSGMSSIYNSPPMNVKRFGSKYTDRYDSSTTTKTIDSCLDDNHLQKSDTQIMRSAMVESDRKEFYSPVAASLFSTAHISAAAINLKENKEQQNRRKLLTRPSSEFSLGTQPELEMDYYDYNVINAGAAPGSYLGMDPAYLVWIPPFDDAAKLNANANAAADDDDDDDDDVSSANEKANNELDDIDPLYEKLRGRMMPKYYLSPRSNSESRTNTPTNQTALTTPTSDEISVHGISQQHHQDIAKASTPYLALKQSIAYLKRNKKQRPRHSKSAISLRPTRGPCDGQAMQLNELNCAPVPTSTSDDPMTSSYVEKETSVVKSPSDLQNFLALDDIQFADESENDYESGVCASVAESSKLQQLAVHGGEIATDKSNKLSASS